MRPAPRIDPSAIRKELKALISANDAPGFVALCQSLKAEIGELLVANRVVESQRLLTVYSNALSDYEHTSAAFTLGILPILPANTRGTVMLMGEYDEVDAYILEHKVDLAIIVQATDDAYSHLISWALKKKDMAYVEQIVVGVVEHLHTYHPNKKAVFEDVTVAILWALLNDKELRMVCTPAIDDAMASMMRETPNPKHHEDYLLFLAQAGMRKTLMKGLELRYFYPLPNFNHQNIAQGFPENPTAEELHWINRSLNIHGIPEKILFDESIDMHVFVEVLRNSHEGRSHWNDLSFETLKSFAHLIDKKTMDTAGKKKRVAILLNGVCEEEANRLGREQTPEQILEDLKKMGIPDFMRATVKMLKITALEDAMGL
jgi:hypothetical protein